jgi:hypothetical protein
VITEGWHAFGVLGEDAEPEVKPVANCRWPEAEVSRDGYFGVRHNCYGDDTSTAFCDVLAVTREKAIARWKALAATWSTVIPYYGGNEDCLRDLIWGLT